jgi:hypothetical protein
MRNALFWGALVTFLGLQALGFYKIWGWAGKSRMDLDGRDVFHAFQ